MGKHARQKGKQPPKNSILRGKKYRWALRKEGKKNYRNKITVKNNNG